MSVGVRAGQPLFAWYADGDTHSRRHPRFRTARQSVARAIARARAAADCRHVTLAGSQAVPQAIRAGLLDEVHPAVVPVPLGDGVRLFAHLGGPVRLEKISVVDAPSVNHLSYRVLKP